MKHSQSLYSLQIKSTQMRLKHYLLITCLFSLQALANINDFSELNADRTYADSAEKLLERLANKLDASSQDKLHKLGALSSPLQSKFELSKLLMYYYISYDEYSLALEQVKAIEQNALNTKSESQLAFAKLSEIAILSRLDRVKGKRAGSDDLKRYYSGLSSQVKDALKFNYIVFVALSERSSREAMLLGTEVNYLSENNSGVGDLMMGLHAAYVVENVPSIKIELLNRYIDFCEAHDIPVKYFIHFYNVISYFLKQIGDPNIVGTYTDRYLAYATASEDQNEIYFASLKKVEQLFLLGKNKEALVLLEQAENGHNSVPERWKLQGKFLKVELLASLGQLERANQLSEYLSNVLNSNGLDEPSEFKIANTLLSSSQGNVASALKQIQAEFRRFRFDVTMDRLNYLEELTNAKEQERKALFDSRDKARQLEQTNQLLVFCIVSISLMAIFLVKMIVSKRKAYEKLEIANKTDLLTGMLNRRFLQMKLEQTFSMLSKSRRSEEAVLLFIDIDMFKSINDNFGHTVGDKVISMVSGQVMDCIRERDYAGRYGGEEFAVILNNLNAAQAMDIAERIRVKVRELEDCTLLGQRKVSVSIGVSAFDDRFKSLNEWLNDADQALYEAKRSGRDQVVRSNFNEPSQIVEV